MSAARWLVWALAAYAGAGLVFAFVFVRYGIQKVDPVAQNSSVWFRLIVLPGVAALWPLLARRWLR